MNFRYLGVMIMAFSILLAVTVYSLSSALINSTKHTDACSSLETCPHVMALNFSYMGYIASGGLFISGLYLFLKAPQPGAVRKRPQNLEPDEKRLYDLIAAGGGMVFQSDLVEKTGFPKARVTRLLDKMEAKGILDRRRRGMTNAIVLK
jgi:uncharacterized membrane protein